MGSTADPPNVRAMSLAGAEKLYRKLTNFLLQRMEPIARQALNMEHEACNQLYPFTRHSKWRLLLTLSDYLGTLLTKT
jgi:hypothetical protein